MRFEITSSLSLTTLGSSCDFPVSDSGTISVVFSGGAAEVGMEGIAGVDVVGAATGSVAVAGMVLVVVVVAGVEGRGGTGVGVDISVEMTVESGADVEGAVSGLLSSLQGSEVVVCIIFGSVKTGKERRK